MIGHSVLGRDIVAYKFSEGAQGDTSSKTGIVITGCHHAREDRDDLLLHGQRRVATLLQEFDKAAGPRGLRELYHQLGAMCRAVQATMRSR